MTTPIVPFPFHTLQLLGVWDYVDAHTELPDGTITYNFGQNPVGRFIIKETGVYSHIVMANNLPIVASGSLQHLTPAEAAVMAPGVLAHFGSWTDDGANGKFTVNIQNSNFANFDGIAQTRIVTNLTLTDLEYANLQTTNGGNAVVFAKLKRNFG